MASSEITYCQKVFFSLLRKQIHQWYNLVLCLAYSNTDLLSKMYLTCNHGMMLMGVTNCFLIEQKACSMEEFNNWHCKPGPKLMTGKIRP